MSDLKARCRNKIPSMKVCGLSKRLGSKIISGIGNDSLGEAG